MLPFGESSDFLSPPDRTFLQSCLFFGCICQFGRWRPWWLRLFEMVILRKVSPIFLAYPTGWSEALVVEAGSIFVIGLWWHQVKKDRWFLMVLSFLGSWVVHEHFVSHVVLFLSHPSALWWMSCLLEHSYWSS
jgi:hypothetical protein